MKKENLPQDESALKDFTREVCYVKNKDGKYEKGLSSGWDVKTEALNVAWEDINDRIKDAANAVKEKKSSPILFFMELNLMDFQTLSAYTGYWKITIKRHLKPRNFSKLNQTKLAPYAKTFKISIDDLITFNGSNIDKYITK